MVNETAQWAILILLMIGLVAVYRELGVILQPAQTSVDGPAVGEKLPPIIRGSVKLGPDHDRVLVAVIAEGCETCNRLLSGIERAGVELERSAIVLVARASTDGYLEALSHLRGAVIDDRGGGVSRSLHAHATPLLLTAGRDWRITRKGITHRVGDFINNS